MRQFLFGEPAFAAGRLQQYPFAGPCGLTGGVEAKGRTDTTEVMYLAVSVVDGGSHLAAVPHKAAERRIDVIEAAGQLGDKALAHTGKPLDEDVIRHDPDLLSTRNGGIAKLRTPGAIRYSCN